MNIPENAPLSDQQIAALNTFSRDQLIWLGGYLTHLVEASSDKVGATSTQAETVRAVAKPLTILYGTESGNCEALADQTVKLAKTRGFKPKLMNMADARVSELAKQQNLLVIVSTWGDGDPPESAETFYNDFMSDAAPKLETTRFSVCALGDTSYEQFCKIGKDFDQRLAVLGGERLTDRMDCDVEYEADFQTWVDRTLTALASLEGAATQAGVATVDTMTEPAIAYGKKNPFPAPLLSRVNLNGRGSAKMTCHVEIGLEGSGFQYDPGDALAVIPENDPVMVEAILDATGFSHAATVTLGDDSEVSLREALTRHFDITTLSSPFIRKYNDLVANDALTELLAPERKAALRDYLWGRQVVDILEGYPSKKLTPENFTNLLRKQTPRLYSIASSLKAHPDEVHLTVGLVEYDTFGRQRKGVTSAYLCERVAESTPMPVYLHHNKNFRLPADHDTPVIMVGPGTGIAPFRAFLEERVATGAKGANWLFFGDQHFLTDFLYQLELQQYLKEGHLSRLDLAFSRDQAKKIYVQHRMLEQAKQLWSWLQEGAHFYVCGDAKRMAGDVHEALLQIAESQGGMSREDAEAYMAALKKAKRYQRDVY